MPILVRSPRSVADLGDEVPGGRGHALILAVLFHRQRIVEDHRDLDDDRFRQVHFGQGLGRQCVHPDDAEE